MKIHDLKWPERDRDYDEDLLLDIEAGIIAYLHRCRNACNSKWVSHRFWNTQLFSDVASATFGAEELRERGNVFYVREVPALLLRSPSEAVIICDIHDSAPFARFTGLDTEPVESSTGRWIDGIYPGVSLRDAVHAFDGWSGNWDGAKDSEYSILTGMVTADFRFASREGELQSLISHPQGSSYMLGWTPEYSPSPPSASGTEALAARWREVCEPATQDAAASGVRAESLATYRNRVLDAKPVSQWLHEQETARAAAEAIRDARRQAWADAREHLEQLELRLRDAEAEVSAAASQRLRPADTSAGIRAQRERLEQAEKALAGLRSDIAILRAVEQLRRDEYWAS
jgi:hypothetical protein